MAALALQCKLGSQGFDPRCCLGCCCCFGLKLGGREEEVLIDLEKGLSSKAAAHGTVRGNCDLCSAFPSQPL